MESLSSTIHAANRALIENGNTDAISTYFSSDYVAHLTDQDVAGGHKLIRGMLELYQRAFPSPTVEVEILLEGSDRVLGSGRSVPSRMGLSRDFPLPDVTWFGATL